MWMVVPCAFHSCWRLFALNQIQLDAYCAMVWRQYEATFKLRPVILIFERNKITECPRKPQKPTLLGITLYIQPSLFYTVGTQCLILVFLPLVCLLLVFFPGDSQFYVEDTLIWIGPCYNVWPLFCLNHVNWKLERCLEIHWNFPVLAPFSSFLSKFFCFLSGHSPSFWNWIMGSLAVTDCWFAVSHCALNNSMTTFNTLLCRHAYIWSDCGHADSTWCKVPNYFYM